MRILYCDQTYILLNNVIIIIINIIINNCHCFQFPTYDLKALVTPRRGEQDDGRIHPDIYSELSCKHFVLYVRTKLK